MTFVSYAQNFEDVMLWRALGRVQGGFYIDAGAAHPDIDSVTRSFYDRGWSGINIEPVAADWRRLQAARPRDVTLGVALGAQAGTADFWVVAGTGLSTLAPEEAGASAERGFPVTRTEVPVVTLAEICRQHVVGEVHFLKVDVEGAEEQALAGADFAAFRPWIVLVEATVPMSTVVNYGGWEPILTDAGYRFAWFDGLNRFYVAGEHWEALSVHFQTPPNVFDDFLRAGDTEWTRRIVLAETSLQHEISRADRAEARADGLAQQLAGERAARISAQCAVEEHARRQAEDAARLAQHEARGRAMEQRAQEAEARVGAMLTSTSWQLTRPLRRIATLAAGVGRRER